jgi:N4-gp56 family major capsid protein
MRLSEWGGNKMDAVRFSLFTAAALPAPLAAETYVPNYYVVGGGTDEDDVEAGDTLTVEAIQEIKLTLEAQKAKPIVVDGEPVYAMVVNPYALHQLKRETEYRDWVREAHIRGADNPFFKGATAMIDGMVIYGSFNAPISTDGGAGGTVPYTRGVAFGSEAFVEGLDENVHSAEDTFDYELEYGVSYEFAFQPRRALELSSLQVLASAPALS